MRAVYLDSSAAVKLFKEEPESAALAQWLSGQGDARVFTSDLARTEVRRAMLAAGAADNSLTNAGEWLNNHAVLRLTAALCDRAGKALPGSSLRSLDALHVESARGLGPALVAFVAYDARLCAVARRSGLAVVSPAPPAEPEPAPSLETPQA